ncbi:MAG: prepilin peptidase [Eubacteriales bacterium]|nr:prepilin peptidase [Eubacteriales bacterium]
MSAYAVLALMIAGTAVVMDIRSACVDNGWILFSLCIGFAWRLFREGAPGIPDFIAGAVLPVLLLSGLFYFRMLGAGDIKLFCALGGVMGAADVCRCILISFFLGAVISLAILIFFGGFFRRICYLIHYFEEYFLTGRVRPYYRRGMSLENFHFTVPIFLSVMFYAGGVY